MIYKWINKLVEYGHSTNLISKEDIVYTRNRLLELFQLDDYNEQGIEKADGISDEISESEYDIEKILGTLTDYAYEQGILKENTVTYRDLFDTKVMGLLVSRPSEVIRNFKLKYAGSPREATDFFYQLSQNSDYIRTYRIKKDLKWITATEYGDLDITINLSKPEKDPKAIAAAKNSKQSTYPKCQLCYENEGYAGRVDHPARQNHRIMPVTICGQNWGFQYSPYVYYPEHCIVFNLEHVPMRIEKATFRKLLDFVIQFPHYFVGSNADLPIVGGSILSHDHFQGGNYEFAMARAEIDREFSIKGFEDVEAGIVAWPMSVMRLRSREDKRLVELADLVLNTWQSYSDETVDIYAVTTEVHNTITPIARKRGDFYELDLVLRNNRTSEEHPFGIYHPHQELHHIKKENIGLIEVMGLAVLPARLKEEMELLKEYILDGKDLRSHELIEKHADWAEKFLYKYTDINKESLPIIIEQEIGKVFLKVLEHAGVFKRTEVGQEAFDRFIDSL